MFNDLHDAVSFLSSWRWPETRGEITAVDVERIQSRHGDRLRLAVAYSFSVNGHGPYTGESFWSPAFFVNSRVIAARRKIRAHRPVTVRYRPDDPSINELDRRAWEDL